MIDWIVGGSGSGDRRQPTRAVSVEGMGRQAGDGAGLGGDGGDGWRCGVMLSAAVGGLGRMQKVG